MEKNPLKCEYFLPFVVDELLGEKKATVKVLKSMDKWYGVTYKEDKPVVVAAIQKLKDDGLYPQKLWGGKISGKNKRCKPSGTDGSNQQL